MFTKISKRFEILIVLLTVAFITGCNSSPKPAESTGVDINLSHLEHLMQDAKVEGRDCSIVHIYCEYPDYSWVGDDDEGISCVDDVARAARAFLNDYQKNENPESAEKAKKLLNYVLALQAEDGQFYNFIWPDFTINKEHENSVKSTGWWAARGYHAIATGAVVLEEYDPGLYDELKRASFITLKRLQKERENKDSWISNIAPDQAGEYILGLLQARTYSDVAAIDPLIEHFVNKILSAQWIKSGEQPSTVHFAYRNTWHAWGAQMCHALALAGKTLERNEWIDAALLESQTFHRELIIHGYLNEFAVEDNKKVKVKTFPQIAYGMSGMIEANMALYHQTGLSEFAATAGWMAAWFNGANLAGIKMYDEKTGRTFDGLLGVEELNKNSGAESTIEALLALQSIKGVEIAEQTFFAKPEYNSEKKGIRFTYPETSKQAELPMSIVLEDGHWVIK